MHFTSWKLYQGQPFALQLLWENGKAFASWSGEVTRDKRGDILNDSSSIVQLGKKFADGLGLDDNQQVRMEHFVQLDNCSYNQYYVVQEIILPPSSWWSFPLFMWP